MRKKLNTQQFKQSVLFFLNLNLIICVVSLFLFFDVTLASAEIPEVKGRVLPLDLSRIPTTTELMAAGQLGGALYPTQEVPEISQKSPIPQNLASLSDDEVRQKVSRNEMMNLSFGRVMQAWNAHEYPQAVVMLKKYIETYPDSPWAAEAVLHLGCEAQFNGRYSEAEKYFSGIIEAHKNNAHPGAKMLVNKSRSRLAVQKVLQNNIPEALEQFKILKQESPDWRHRTYAAHWIQRLSREKGEQLALVNCGTQALAYLLEKNGKDAEARAILDVLPSSANGYSLQDLKRIAGQYGYTLTGLQLQPSELKDIPLPAVAYLQYDQVGQHGHYWILEAVQQERLMLYDPQSGRRFQQQVNEFAQEWSGYMLVFAGADKLPDIQLTEAEMGQLYGACCGVERAEQNIGNPCSRYSGNGSANGTSRGSPIWKVNMINMNFFLTDTPLWFESPIGPAVEITLSYNAQSAIARYEPFGNKWQFNYASYLVVDPGETVTVFMPDGRRETYTPNGVGGYQPSYRNHNTLTKIASNHFELRLPDDTVYVYNIPAGTTSQQPFLVSIREAHGQALTLTYNTNVQLTRITDALGKAATLTYNAQGLVASVTDSFSRSATFEYDANDNLTKITDMGGYWTSFTYTPDVYLASIKNAKGQWTVYTEPADGINNGLNHYPAPGGIMWEDYRITITNPLGYKEEYYYEGYYGYSWYVSPRDYIEYGSTSTNNYASNAPRTKYEDTTVSGQGEISRMTLPEGGALNYGYDSTGNRISVADSLGHTTSSTYNAKGNVTSITDPKGNITTLAYAANGVDVTAITNGLGTINMAYNSTHHLTAITDRLNRTTSIAYNSYGQVTSITDARGVVTTYTYNASRQLQQISRAGTVLDSFTYDAVGRIRTHTDSTGLTLTYTYNNLDQLTQITYPDGKTVTYTYAAWHPRVVERSVDRAGRTVKYTYDPLKRLTDLLDPANGLTHLTYDPNGNPVELVDANGQVTKLAYDTDNRPTTKTYQDGKTESLTYNSMGLVTAWTNARGITTTYTYDANDNLTDIAYSDGTPGVTYTYDAYDRVTQRQDGIGATLFGYDANSRLTSRDGPWANDTLTYQYDQVGRRTTLTPQGGAALTYTYDNFDRLTGIQIGAGTYAYGYTGANPMVKSLARPNGSVTTYQHDTLNRLTTLANKNSSNAIINQYVYTYNVQDVRGSETITNGTPITTFQNGRIQYTYNTVNQLLSSANPSRTFLYDADGNLTQGYTPDGYVFTAEYDAENRLKSLEYTDSGSVLHKFEYRYAGNDFLAETKEYQNTTLIKTTRFVRNGLLPVQERDANNAVVREYAWGPNLGGGIGGLLQLKQGGQNYAYLYDGKGNVTALLNSAQAATATYAYDPFGLLMAKTGTLDQPVMFSTKPYDANSGLSYYGYRFYAPVIGKWMTRDPLGETGGINLYGFVRNNAINWIDLWGLKPGDKFPTADEAAIDALDYSNTKTKKEGKEYGGWIFKTCDGQYSYPEPTQGTKTEIPNMPEKGTSDVAWYHTHPNLPGYDIENFSGDTGDKGYSKHYNATGYLGTPSDAITSYDPVTGRITIIRMSPWT